MSSQGHGERHPHGRTVLNLPVRIGTEGQMHDGTIQEISDGGLRVRTSGSFPLGSMVNVYVQFPSATTHVRGRVVREASEGSSISLVINQGGAALVRACEHYASETAPQAEKAAAAPKAPPARKTIAAAPAAPVKRHLETSRGNTYEVEIESGDDGWRLAIFQSPRGPHTLTPVHEGKFKDYPGAEQALREFLKAH